MSKFRRMSNLQKFVSTDASFHNHVNLDRNINQRSTEVIVIVAMSDVGAGQDRDRE